MAAVQYNTLPTFDLGDDDDVFFGFPTHPADDHVSPMERDTSMANWTSNALQVIDLMKMKDMSVEQAQPAEEDVNGGEDSGHSTDGDGNEGYEGNDFNYYEFINEDDEVHGQFPEDGTDQAGQLPIGIEILSNPVEVPHPPIFPSLPDPEDMDIDLDSFFAPPPPKEVPDEDGASTISTSGPDTIMTIDDCTTSPPPKLGRDTLRHAFDQAIEPEPEVAKHEDSDERPAYSPLVQVSSLDRNSPEPENTAGEANLARDQLRDIHNGLRSNMFANDDDDDDSVLSPPPDSPDCAMLDIEETHVTEEPATATVDWTIKFAADLLSGPITRQRVRPSNRKTK
jgi:hypothetical protein